ncbi:MAG: protein-L-isoaspartate(D-aspartate) O-methyltransferase [Lentisphaerae bacterium]|nr:protein-L-isoaspartate(D-aspartate) O-methyltransferase [Lentisphaerota bacterium]
MLRIMQCTDNHHTMLETLRRHGIKNGTVLQAMSRVPRDAFAPTSADPRDNPYGDHPYPIGHGQTMSQPYIVAYMTERLNLKQGERILEIGTGSGYQTAILAELGLQVYTIERISKLAEHTVKKLTDFGYSNIHVRIGDGYKGWKDESPFDAIIVTCAPAIMPTRLIQQLGHNGRMILPIGIEVQRLVLVRKKGDTIEEETDIGVRFVPMVHGES